MDLHIENMYDIDIQTPLDRQGKPLDYQATIKIIEGKIDTQCPMIITSDLHSNTKLVLDYLEKKLEKTKEWTFISAGDMAGNGKKGSNGDATPNLQWAQGLFRRIYFVQGNHDLESSITKSMKNSDGTYCHISRRIQEIEELGYIAGIDGIMSTKKKLHRISPKEYFREIKRLTKEKLEWLITHEVPCIPSISKQKKGSSELAKIVIENNVKHHVFGHCYFPHWHGTIKNSRFLAVDGRVLLLRPI
ncbi:metallophosphoesterase [Candidatus Uabimicrobium sp. HlEnr_7]|uniref:metallophosphoesterase family protein n=1 Tax=Candidatus Uabimicrobium helgolandensis TaxID=3095367 RepID=UPI0035560FF9